MKLRGLMWLNQIFLVDHIWGGGGGGGGGGCFSIEQTVQS